MGYLQNATATAATTDTAGKAVGGMVLLSSKTISGGTFVTFTSVISSTYKNYCLVYSNLKSTLVGTFEGVVSIDNGSSYIGANYFSTHITYPYNSATLGKGQATALLLLSGLITSSGSGEAGVIYFMNLQNGGQFMCFGNSIYQTSGPVAQLSKILGYNTATSVNALKFLVSAGVIISGTFSLYGIIE